MNNYYLVALIFTSYTTLVNCESIVWNLESNTEVSFHTVLSKSNEVPVIIFNHPNFLLSSFSKEAGAYGFKNDGGKLKNLKKWIDRSKGYVVTNDAISSQLLQYFDKINFEPENPPEANDVAVLVVDILDWQDLNSKAEEVRKIFKGKNFVAILTTVGQYRNKREAFAMPTVATQAPTYHQNFTFINETDCMLYADDIYFLVQYKEKDSNNINTCKVTLPKNPTGYTANCTNYSGRIGFSYAMQPPGMAFDDPSCSPTNGTLNSLAVTMSFYQSDTTKWWYVENVYLEASGSIIAQSDSSVGQFSDSVFEIRNTSWEFSYIQAYQLFGYTCSAPPAVFCAEQYGPVTVKSTTYQLKYGLGFKNIQVQPFYAPPGPGSSFTDNIDDCTPFFSIYIWMFILSALLLFGIVICGMGMMGSLRTMDRFDDIKAKTIVVNVVN